MNVSLSQPATAVGDRDATFAPSPPRLDAGSGGVDLRAWVARAAAGDVIEYHRGYLAVDRNPISSRLSETARARLDLVADLALAMEATGRVLLVQRRLGDGVFSYLAIATTTGPRPVAPWAPHVVAVRTETPRSGGHAAIAPWHAEGDPVGKIGRSTGT